MTNSRRITKQSIWKWILSGLLLLLPLFAVAFFTVTKYSESTLYSPLIWSFRLPVYGACVAIAIAISELRFLPRLWPCIIVAILAFFLQHIFDVIQILGIACAAGALSVGGKPDFSKLIWKSILYRVIRTIAAFGLATLAFFLPLPRSDKVCPMGGGYISDQFISFVAITYVIVFGLIIFDFCSYLVLRKSSKTCEGVL